MTLKEAPGNRVTEEEARKLVKGLQTGPSEDPKWREEWLPNNSERNVPPSISKSEGVDDGDMLD